MSQVDITAEAQKQYQHLPKSEQNKIKKKLVVIEKNPLIGKKLTGELVGLYSIKAWPYRIVYTFDSSQNQVTIHLIQHRQGAYK